MMTLTYIFHSGFVLEAERCILVFDYWMDPEDVMRQFEGSAKHVYVFASHFHEDHFTRDIFSWRDSRHTYILSKDILRHKRATVGEADVWLTKGGTWEDANIRVTATGSNDSGVSWIVEVDGKRIFHAGDLCNWYARFLAEEPIPETVQSAEFGTINPVREEKMFLGELKDIARLLQEHCAPRPSGEPCFDIAMFPVDGRIGNGYTLGARQFIERFRVGILVPMHFGASGCESAWRMEPFCQEVGIPFWSIAGEGESIAIVDGLIIRKSTMADIPRMREIFAHARQFMAQTGNPNQWVNDYPSEAFLGDDINSGDSYVCILEAKDGREGGCPKPGTNGRIVATFLLRGGIDPTYNKIEGGSWLNEEPYATIHRIASDGSVHGILHTAMTFALRQYGNIRIDTHRDNRVMQAAVLKEGFRYCGIIYCWSGDERLAYQYSTPK